MEEQIAIQKILQKELATAQGKNPRYSMRAFSQRVGLNPGALSGILNGKRRISAKLARKIAINLHLDPQERANLISLFPKKREYLKVGSFEEAKGTVLNYLQVSATQFKVIAEWEHYAILSLIKTDDFRSDIPWIAQRLGITESKVQDAIVRLIEVQMINREPGTKEISRVAGEYRTLDDVLNISLQKAHLQSMELAAEAMRTYSVDERDLSSMTMPIDPKKMTLAKEIIRRFQDELNEAIGHGEKTEVYRLSVQLYPLTVIRNSKMEKLI